MIVVGVREIKPDPHAGENMICFVCDNFVDDKNGGAELSLEALISQCPEEVVRVRSRDFAPLKAAGSSLVVFSNIAELDFAVMRSIAASGMRYVFIENDYKYCCYRNPLKHRKFEGVDCDCHNKPFGEAIADFMLGARMVFWKSQRQMIHYGERFPELYEKPGAIISCNFSDSDIDRLLELRSKKKNGKYLVMESDSWVKGVKESIEYCKKNGLSYRVVGGKSYRDFVEEMAEYSGLVFMPVGYDTCPRMVVEAKIMGLDVKINENVQNDGEEWFAGNHFQIADYLRERPNIFWQMVGAA